jgi:hypothetical protein
MRSGVRAQFRLHVRVAGQKMDQDADGGGDGSDLPGGPVAQQADQLRVGQRPAVDVFSQQKPCDIPLVTGLPPTPQFAEDQVFEPVCVFGEGWAVQLTDGPQVAIGPVQQGRLHFHRPAEEAALHASGIGQAEVGHGVNRFTRGEALHEHGGGLAADGRKRIHALRCEEALDQSAERSVDGWIHAVGHRQMGGDLVAEYLGPVQRIHHVGVAGQDPAQSFIAGHRGILTAPVPVA